MSCHTNNAQGILLDLVRHTNDGAIPQFGYPIDWAVIRSEENLVFAIDYALEYSNDVVIVIGQSDHVVDTDAICNYFHDLDLPQPTIIFI